MPDYPDYNPWSSSAGVNPATFLEQLGLALSIMGQRDPSKAAALYLHGQQVQSQQQDLQQKRFEHLRDQMGLAGLANLVANAFQVSGDQTSPSGIEGLKPLEQTGFNQPEAFQRAQRTLDPTSLQQLAAISPSVMKLLMDPQMQQLWQGTGLLTHPESAKFQAQQGNRATTAQTLAGPMSRLTGLSEEDARSIVGAIQPEHLGGWLNAPFKQQALDVANTKTEIAAQRAQTYQQLADLHQKVYALKEQYQNGLTPMAQKQMEQYDAQITRLNEIAATLQEKRPFIASQAQANIEHTRAGTEKIQTEIPFIGQPKPTKPSEGDKSVEAIAAQMQQMTNDPEGLFGGAGKTAEQKIQEQMKQIQTINPQQYPLWLRAYQLYKTRATSSQPQSPSTRPATAEEWLKQFQQMK